MRPCSSTANGRVSSTRSSRSRALWLLLLSSVGTNTSHVLAAEATAEATAETAVTDNQNERLPATFYNAEVEGAVAGDTHDRDPFLIVVPSVSFEKPRFGAGVAGKARFNLSDKQVEEAQVEIAGSFSFLIHDPSKYRVVFGAGWADRNAPEDLVGTTHDPAGQSESVGVQIRRREQIEVDPAKLGRYRPVLLGDPQENGKNYEQDSIFTRPEETRSWTLGYTHRRDEADGSEVFSSSDVWYFDYVLPFNDGDGGTLAAAIAYASTSYPHRAIASDDEDDIYSAGLRYRYRFDRGVLPFPWQAFLAVTRVRQDSAAPAFDAWNTVITAGVRFRGGRIENNAPGPQPENEDSTTLSPTDLGPPRPRP